MGIERLPRRSLRRVVSVALLLLAVVVLAGVVLELSMARSVHHDILRLFEEQREVSLARGLVEELRGADRWVQVVPDASRENQPLIVADVRQHYLEAAAMLKRFPREGDPSGVEHDEDEHRLLERITANLALLGEGLEQAATLGELKESVEIALNAANAVASAVEDESREIGESLDRSTDEMFQVLVVLGIGSILTVMALAWVLRFRVLQPAEELREFAARFGRGELELRPVVRRNDELGELAHAFRQMAEQLREHQDDLERRVDERSREVLRTARLAQLGTLAAGIAHEINNPLASIAACSEGLLRDLDRGQVANDGLRDYLEILRKEAMRARDITQKLLRFAHQDATRREVIDLGEQAVEVAALFEHQAESAGVELSIDCSPAGALCVYGDASEWRQVFFNLLRNAIDASDNGGAVAVTGRRVGAEIVVDVRDRGLGIPEAERERVFEPFVTTKAPGKGTGLGLAIVHRIVSAHDGVVRIEDAEPGARFTITVPAATG